MSEKYLILEFRDAIVFLNKYSKDVNSDHKGNRTKRTKFFKEPITVNQISNMLHVLFGERPVPSFRSVSYNKVDHYYDMALKSYLSISNPKVEHKLSDKVFIQNGYISEIIQTKKAMNNSWSKSGALTWERVFQLLKKEVYEHFIKELSAILKINPLDYTTEQIKEKLLSYVTVEVINGKPFYHINDVRLTNLYKYLCDNKKSSLYNYLIGNAKDMGDINKNKDISITVNTNIEKVCSLSGQIYVPVTDMDIEKLKSQKGCATLLDGGLVLIKGIKRSEDLSPEGFTKVSTISTDKIVVEQKEN